MFDSEPGAVDASPEDSKREDALPGPASPCSETWSAYPAPPAPFPVLLTVTPPHPCAYLPGREATTRAFRILKMTGLQYQAFMDASFRRSGNVIYQPVCRGCRACEPVRVPVSRFRPSKSQRRCLRKNGDLSVEVSTPIPTKEKYALYEKYQAQRHASLDITIDSFVEFLYQSPVETLEFAYRNQAGKLLGVGICDICEKSVSSVYFYYDPAESARGLGIFSAMQEIAFSAEKEVTYYYLGYRVRGCSRMDYKSTFRPFEVLLTNGEWQYLQ